MFKMKGNHVFLQFMLVWLMLSTACGREDKIGITSIERHNSWGEAKPLRCVDFIEYDSVTFSDGSYAVRQLKYAPQNWLVRYVDKEGRLVATISSASEAYAQCLIYGYDGKNRLKYLLRFDAGKESCLFDETSDSAYLHFRMAIDSIDFRQPDMQRHTLSEITYGDDGFVHVAAEKPSGKTIKAPKGYKLEVSVDPCVSFWSSDLRGGRFFLKVDVVPATAGLDAYSIKRFVDFFPATEEYYRNGQRYKMVCHPRPDDCNGVKMTVTRRTEGGANIYACQYGDRNDTLISTWKDGCLKEYILKSKWGTVLNEIRYYYLRDGKVRKEERRYDFKARALKPAAVEIIERSGIKSEDEEMDPLKTEAWDNVYRE